MIAISVPLSINELEDSVVYEEKDTLAELLVGVTSTQIGFSELAFIFIEFPLVRDPL